MSGQRFRHTVGRAVIVAGAMTMTLYAASAHHSWTAPPSASSRANPLEPRGEVVAGGRRLFADKCAVCHGDDGTGTKRASDLSSPDTQKQSDGAPFWKITQGNTRAGMPTFSYLPEPQRWQLVLQIRTLRSP